MTGQDRADAADAAVALQIDVLHGSPTEEELAALIAVVTEAYVREAEDAVADDATGRSGWQLSQRAMRRPLRRELGWGRYGG